MTVAPVPASLVVGVVDRWLIERGEPWEDRRPGGTHFARPGDIPPLSAMSVLAHRAYPERPATAWRAMFRLRHEVQHTSIATADRFITGCYGPQGWLVDAALEDIYLRHHPDARGWSDERIARWAERTVAEWTPAQHRLMRELRPLLEDM